MYRQVDRYTFMTETGLELTKVGFSGWGLVQHENWTKYWVVRKVMAFFPMFFYAKVHHDFSISNS